VITSDLQLDVPTSSDPRCLVDVVDEIAATLHLNPDLLSFIQDQCREVSISKTNFYSNPRKKQVGINRDKNPVYKINYKGLDPARLGLMPDAVLIAAALDHFLIKGLVQRLGHRILDGTVLHRKSNKLNLIKIDADAFGFELENSDHPSFQDRDPLQRRVVCAFNRIVVAYTNLPETSTIQAMPEVIPVGPTRVVASDGKEYPLDAFKKFRVLADTYHVTRKTLQDKKHNHPNTFPWIQEEFGRRESLMLESAVSNHFSARQTPNAGGQPVTYR
jgi:hypothetical protein